MKRYYGIGALVLLALLVMAGCGLGGLDTPAEGHGITIRVADLMNARTILPTGSLTAARYALIGTGTSGQALGASFDVDLTPATPSIDLDLLPGGWNIDATVWSDEDVAVGDGNAIFTVVVGEPQTVIINCVPYTGAGTLAMSISWIPNIIAVPEVAVDMKPFVGGVIPVSMNTVPGGTTSTATASLLAGWYTGAMRLSDNGVLSAGVVRAVRIAQDMTTTWSEYLTVSALAGQITMDVSYNLGPALVLSSNVTTLDPTDDPVFGGHGERLLINLVPGATFEVTVAEPAHDADSTVAYAWYMNGVLTALSTTTGHTLDSDDFALNTRNYLSVVALQSDGARAGSLNFAIVKGDYDPAQYVVAGWLRRTDGGPISEGTFVVRARDAAGVVVASSTPVGGVGGYMLHYDFPTPLPAGIYHLVAFNLDPDPDVFKGYWGSTSLVWPPNFPVNVEIPHPLATTSFDIWMPW